jgi:hypothetical protein
MTQKKDTHERDDGLYVSDIEIARRLGFCERTYAKILDRIARGVAGIRPYPQRDPIFCNRRFWPAVLQWHLDYHHVRTGKAASVAPVPMWEEHFDEPAPKANEPKRTRPQLASA